MIAGPSAINSLLKSFVRMQVITKDSSIPDTVKEGMLAELRKSNSVVVGGLKQQADASKSADALGSVSGTTASDPADPAADPKTDTGTAASKPTSGSDRPEMAYAKTTGTLVDKTA